MHGLSFRADRRPVRRTARRPAHRPRRGWHQDGLLSTWGNDSARWTNTWNRPAGYEAINSVWRAPRSGQLFEVQFHTPESKAAQLETHTGPREHGLSSGGPPDAPAGRQGVRRGRHGRRRGVTSPRRPAAWWSR